MKKVNRGVVSAVCCTICLLLFAGAISYEPTSAQSEATSAYLAHEIELSDLDLPAMDSLVWSPVTNSFLLLRGQDLVILDVFGQQNGGGPVGLPVRDPANVTYDPISGSLLLFDAERAELAQVPEADLFRASQVKRSNLRNLRIGQAAGMAVNPATGELFFLNPSGRQIISLLPVQGGSYDNAAALSRKEFTLSGFDSAGQVDFRGLAYNPQNGSLYTLNRAENRVYQIDTAGQAAGTIDLAALGIAKADMLTAAPSINQTDDPGIYSLHLTGSDASGQGMLYEIAIDQPAGENIIQAALTATLVRTIQTSQWNPSSPDPAGIEYNPGLNRLQVVDSEVDEMPIYQGANTYFANLNGSLQSTCTTLAWSKEPTGTAVNPGNGNLFFSDDGKDRIFEVSRGNDGNFCTGDDVVTFFSTTPLGSGDAEGVAFANGRLYIVDGVNQELYSVHPGPNGRFDGTDDTFNQYDTAGWGLRDPEGIGYNAQRNSLFLISRRDRFLAEVSLNGQLLNTFDASAANMTSPAGVGSGPGTAGSSDYSVYVTDRGVDNNADPNENDGKIYEFSLGGSGSPTPPPTPPPGTTSIYLSTAENGTLGNLSGVRDEDIVLYNGSSYSMVFDGSDVGVGGVDLDAFFFLDSDSILMSFHNPLTIGNLGTVADHDIVRFDATSLGSNTSGSFSLYFDGDDVGLTASSEDIDALHVLSDGRIILSTVGNLSVTGVSGKDEDLYAFTPSSLGANTAGTWALYFDGSDVGLADAGGEDVYGVDIASNGNIRLSTLKAFNVPGVSGQSSDVFVCAPMSTGNNTACTYSLLFVGSSASLSARNVDAFDLP